MKLLNLKPIPIAHAKNVYHLDKKKLEVIKKTKYITRYNGLCVSENVSLLEDKSLAPLKKFIVQQAKEYVLGVLGIKDQIYLTQSWSTLNPTEAFHEAHEHPNTFISAVYYAQCKNSHLRFYLNTSSIREGFNFEYTIDKFNVYNSNMWTLPVKQGDIVLFPGHIRHGSLANKSSDPRIIVGANFFIKGKLGSNEQVSLITI